MKIDHRSARWPSAGPVLNERRAIFVYEAARLQADAVDSHVVPPPWDERDEAFRAQFRGVIAMMCGPNRKSSPSELHQDWVEAYEVMGWRHGELRDDTEKTHPDMVPFEELGLREQAKDVVFVALCEIARTTVLDYDGFEGTAPAALPS